MSKPLKCLMAGVLAWLANIGLGLLLTGCQNGTLPYEFGLHRQYERDEAALLATTRTNTALIDDKFWVAYNSEKLWLNSQK